MWCVRSPNSKLKAPKYTFRALNWDLVISSRIINNLDAEAQLTKENVDWCCLGINWSCLFKT